MMDESVAATLREARSTKGLELSDIAEITHVRKEYLKALEEGRYQDLPEDIYSRNFLRLYAQALGLEDAKLLDRYTRERRAALGITPDEPLRTTEVIGPEVTPAPSRRGGGWLITLLLLGALGGLLYFAYSRNLLTALFNPNANQTITTEPTLPEVTEPTTESTDTHVNEDATLSDTSEEMRPSETTEEPLAASESSSDATSLDSTDTMTSEVDETSTGSNEPLSSSTEDVSNTESDEDSDAVQTSTETTTPDLSSEPSDVEVSSNVANASNDSSDEEATADTVDDEITNDNNASNSGSAPTTSSTDTTTNSTQSSEDTEVRFTLITDPPGADASIDNYPFATRTPVFNAPVSARESRVLRIDLEGYEPYTELIDVLADTSLSISLKPVSTASTDESVPTPTTTPSTTTPRPLNNQGNINLAVEAETWLEVYQSTERGEGEQLYYGTAQSGETLTYTLPVYIHVGNAAGVRVKENNRDVGLMGSSGEVTGRAFGQPLPEAEGTDESPEPDATETQGNE